MGRRRANQGLLGPSHCCQTPPASPTSCTGGHQHRLGPQRRQRHPLRVCAGAAWVGGRGEWFCSTARGWAAGLPCKLLLASCPPYLPAPPTSQTIMGVESIGGLRVLAVNILGCFLANKDNNIRWVKGRGSSRWAGRRRPRLLWRQQEDGSRMHLTCAHPDPAATLHSTRLRAWWRWTRRPCSATAPPSSSASRTPTSPSAAVRWSWCTLWWVGLGGCSRGASAEGPCCGCLQAGLEAHHPYTTHPPAAPPPIKSNTSR